MKKLILIFLGLLMFSCGSSKKATSEKYTLEKISGFSSEEISEKYPDADIKEGVGMFEEGTVERPYSILYPNTPDEIHITWTGEEREKIYDIYFSGNGKWKSREGIGIGTSLESLNELNGKTVDFYGFGWDYSGAVVWNGGKFEGSKLHVFLAPAGKIPEKFAGDHLIKASEKEIKELDLRVESIIYRNEN